VSDNYPSDWDDRRKRVYKRDNYTCQNCGIKGGRKGHTKVHAHHIVPTSKGGSHNMSNLTTICRQCHEAIHSENITARQEESPNNHPDPDNFEGVKKGALVISLQINEFNRLCGEISSTTDNIIKYVKKMFSHTDNSYDALPTKLEAVYISERVDFSNVIAELRSLSARTQETLPKFDFSDGFVDKAESLVETYLHYIQAIIELEEAFDRIAGIEDNEVILHVTDYDTIEWDVDLDIAAEQASDAARQLAEANDEMMKEVNRSF
jgi:hypothetical protein